MTADTHQVSMCIVHLTDVELCCDDWSGMYTFCSVCKFVCVLLTLVSLHCYDQYVLQYYQLVSYKFNIYGSMFDVFLLAVLDLTDVLPTCMLLYNYKFSSQTINLAAM